MQALRVLILQRFLRARALAVAGFYMWNVCVQHPWNSGKGSPRPQASGPTCIPQDACDPLDVAGGRGHQVLVSYYHHRVAPALRAVRCRRHVVPVAGRLVATWAGQRDGMQG